MVPDGEIFLLSHRRHSTMTSERSEAVDETSKDLFRGACLIHVQGRELVELQDIEATMTIYIVTKVSIFDPAG
jgi:hypothetical protein